MITFAEASEINGGLAQLARAFDWQSKGHRFESGILHMQKRVLYYSIGHAFFIHVGRKGLDIQKTFLKNHQTLKQLYRSFGMFHFSISSIEIAKAVKNSLCSCFGRLNTN